MYVDSPCSHIHRTVRGYLGTGQKDAEHEAETERAERDRARTVHNQPDMGGSQDSGIPFVRQGADGRQL